MKFPAAFAVLLAGIAPWAVGADVGQAPRYEPAVRPQLQVEWPGRRDREAVVILEFDVLANGKVVNIGAAEGGFHEKRFVDAAIAAVKRSKWRPRRINGEAVDSPGMRLSIVFSLQGMEPGITQQFREEALKVEKLLKEGDYAGGEFHAQWMVAEKVTLRYEYAILQAQLGQSYMALGRYAEAEAKFALATARSGAKPQYLQLLDTPPRNHESSYLLEKELILPLLALRMRALAAQGLALEAMQVYYELAGLEMPAADAPEAQFAAHLTARIRGPEELRARIEFRYSRGWRQFLSRSRFRLEKVDGNIDSLTLDCAAGTRTLNYQPGEEWTVPEGWGPCAVGVGADLDTTLEFVEPSDVNPG